MYRCGGYVGEAAAGIDNNDDDGTADDDRGKEETYPSIEGSYVLLDSSPRLASASECFARSRLVLSCQGSEHCPLAWCTRAARASILVRPGGGWSELLAQHGPSLLYAKLAQTHRLSM